MALDYNYPFSSPSSQEFGEVIAAGLATTPVDLSGGRTGSTPRPVTAKLGEFPTVFDFGAKGDTLTGDAAAFRKGIDALAADGGGVLLVPYLGSGKYYNVSDEQIVLKSGVVLAAVGSISGMGFPGYRPRLHSTTPGWVVDTIPVCNSGGLIGLHLTGPSAGTVLGGLRVASSSVRFNLIGCTFNGFGEQAVLLDVSSKACSLSGVLAQNCLMNRTRSGQDGVLNISGADHSIDGGPEITASLSSAKSDANLYCAALYLQATNCSVIGGVYEISDIGVVVSGSLNKLIGVRADLNQGHGLLLAGAAGSNKFTGFHAYRDGQDTDATFDGVQVPSTAVNNKFMGCVSETTGGDTKRHRYGFNDAVTGDANKNYYTDCLSVLHRTTAYNIASAGSSVRLPDGPVKTFAASDTTPSVDQYCSFITAAGTQNVTTFTNGVDAQILYLQGRDANTTFVHNAGVLALLTGANTVTVANKMYMFKKVGAVWRQIV